MLREVNFEQLHFQTVLYLHNYSRKHMHGGRKKNLPSLYLKNVISRSEGVYLYGSGLPHYFVLLFNLIIGQRFYDPQGEI